MRIGIYAGSFDPFHVGHYDILLQAEEVFNLVFVAVGTNPEKNYESRSELPASIGNISMYYTGLLTDKIKSLETLNPSNKYFLIRGLRNGHDLEYEQNQISFMKQMYPTLKVTFFICDPKYHHISSSALKSIRKFSEEEYQKYIVK